MIDPAARHAFLARLIVAIARAPGGDALVLRGGMAMRAWLPRGAARATRDLDYAIDPSVLGTYDVAAIRAIVDAALVDADPPFARASLTAGPIWADTEFPGVRLGVDLRAPPPAPRLTLDVGFGDPLVPAPTTIAIDGVEVRCVRPETQLAWKLHVVCELGPRFRPKDLADLVALVAHAPLDDAALGPAIDAAFTSRGYTWAQAVDTLRARHLSTKAARTAFAPPYRERWGELPDVVATIRARLDPILSAYDPSRR